MPKYIKNRDEYKFKEIGGLSDRVKVLVGSRDRIGWEHFVDGLISKIWLNFNVCIYTCLTNVWTVQIDKNL